MTKLDGISFPKLFDFIAFMESESIINEMLSNPMLPLYVVQKLLGRDMSYKMTTRGPLGITQIFLEDYMTRDNDDYASAKVVKAGLVERIPQLKSIPLFDIVAIMNWFDKFGDVSDTWEHLYDNYYGPYDGKPLLESQLRRVGEYLSKFPDDDDYWLTTQG